MRSWRRLSRNRPPNSSSSVGATRTFDHVDQRVRSLEVAKPFYDGLLREFGFRGRPHGEGTHVYLRVLERSAHEAFALIEDPAHQCNRSCLAFRADSPAEVDRIAATLPAIGAQAIEGPMPCPEYTESYYAVFFTDPDGNRLEVAFR
jgi:catechol 2,3-dioxygenase-like lactoylglutathione lyase family enzyme